MTNRGDDGDETAAGHEPLNGVPSLVWLMLGVVVVLAFVAALVMVFAGPSPMKSPDVTGPAQRMPMPARQAAPATPTPSPPPTEVH